MNSYAKYIENMIGQEPENTLLEASVLYRKLFSSVPELSYYKTLERMTKQRALVHLAKGIYYRPKKSRFGLIPISENEIVRHYTSDARGIVVGYKLYNQKGLTTQISKRVEVLSSALSEQKKNINNVYVRNCGLKFTENTIPVIETLEILQNYNHIEDINKSALVGYMKEFSLTYCDSATVYVLKNWKYKKSTIAFLESFLEFFHISNTLNQFLSTLSSYAIPKIEELYGESK